MVTLFNGVVVPYAQLSVFWRYWMYYVNPSTWWIAGMLAATLPGIPVVCTDAEAAHFDAPPGQTCLEYAGAFVQQAGRGYLTNPDATADCGYCPYSDGTDFLATLNVLPSDKWRNFGIFLAFVVINWLYVSLPPPSGVLLRCFCARTLTVGSGWCRSSSTRRASRAGPSAWARCSACSAWCSTCCRSRSSGGRRMRRRRRDRITAKMDMECLATDRIISIGVLAPYDGPRSCYTGSRCSKAGL